MKIRSVDETWENTVIKRKQKGGKRKPEVFAGGNTQKWDFTISGSRRQRHPRMDTLLQLRTSGSGCTTKHANARKVIKSDRNEDLTDRKVMYASKSP